MYRLLAVLALTSTLILSCEKEPDVTEGLVEGFVQNQVTEEVYEFIFYRSGDEVTHGWFGESRVDGGAKEASSWVLEVNQGLVTLNFEGEDTNVASYTSDEFGAGLAVEGLPEPGAEQ